MEEASYLKTHSNIPCLGFGVEIQGMAHVHNEYATVENLVIGKKVSSVFPFLYDVDGASNPELSKRFQGGVGIG